MSAMPPVAPHELLSGPKIRRLREAQMMTRSDAAVKSGVDYRRLAKIEEGAIPVDPRDTLRLAWLYQVPPQAIDSRLTAKMTGPIDAPILIDERRRVTMRIERQLVALDRDIHWLGVSLGIKSREGAAYSWFGNNNGAVTWTQAYDTAYLLEIKPTLLSKLLTDTQPPPYIPALFFGDTEPIGSRIHRARLARGRTLEGIARRAGLTDDEQRAVEACLLQPRANHIEIYRAELRIPGL